MTKFHSLYEDLSGPSHCISTTNTFHFKTLSTLKQISNTMARYYQDFDLETGADVIDDPAFAQLVYGNQSAGTNDTLVIDTVDAVVSSPTDLSDNQEILLILFQIFSAILSLIGSSVIVFKIVRHINQNNSSTPYDRIILGLSSCDIVSSFTYAVAPFLLPSNTSKRVWALGNDTTCTWIGFLAQLACFWAIWYNCILSFYYLLTVRFQVKRKDFTRKYELLLHLTGAIFFPLTSLIGLIGNWYSEMRYAMMCWIGEVPKGCKNCYGVPVAYTFGAFPTVVTLLSVITNNVIIYIFVLRKLSIPPPSTDSEVENSTTTQRFSTQQRLRKEAAMQGFLYVSTFLLTFLPAFAIQILEGMIPIGEENLQQMYPLLVLNSILMPLQGFFNVFIYIRPTYIRFSDANPDDSILVILKQALFDPNIPRISSGAKHVDSLDHIQEQEENCEVEVSTHSNTGHTRPLSRKI